jgi:hypothetical protein
MDMSEGDYEIWSGYHNDEGYRLIRLRSYAKLDQALAHANWLVGPDSKSARGEVRDPEGKILYRINRDPDEQGDLGINPRPRARLSALAVT